MSVDVELIADILALNKQSRELGLIRSLHETQIILLRLARLVQEALPKEVSTYDQETLRFTRDERCALLNALGEYNRDRRARGFGEGDRLIVACSSAMDKIIHQTVKD